MLQNQLSNLLVILKDSLRLVYLITQIFLKSPWTFFVSTNLSTTLSIVTFILFSSFTNSSPNALPKHARKIFFGLSIYYIALLINRGALRYRLIVQYNFPVK